MNSGSNNFPWREWTAAMLWLVLIAIESTPWLSYQNTGHVLYQVLIWLLGTGNESGVASLNTALREVGHVTGYGVLSWLLFRAWRVTLRSSRLVVWAFSWSAIAFFMTAAVASLDEWHQTYLPSRTGSFHDVLLDSTAALVAQLLLFAFLRKRAARVEENSTVAVGD